jgi:hypothetical protein
VFNPIRYEKIRGIKNKAPLIYFRDWRKGEEVGFMGIQIYGSDRTKPEQLIKLISDKEETILEYVRAMEREGYEILEFPPIENHRRQFNCNVRVFDLLVKCE